MASPSSSVQQIWGSFDPTSMPTLRGLLESPQEETKNSSQGETTSLEGVETSMAAIIAKGAPATRNVNIAGYVSASSGQAIPTMTTTSRSTSKPSNIPYFGETTHHRGEKIGVNTLAKYLAQQKLFDVESFPVTILSC